MGKINTPKSLKKKSRKQETSRPKQVPHKGTQVICLVYRFIYHIDSENMNLKKVILGVVIALLYLINISIVPVTVRILTYSLFLPIGILSSCLALYFYSKIPETQYSVLTCAAKSVIGYHIIFSGTVLKFFKNFLLLLVKLFYNVSQSVCHSYSKFII